MKPQSLGIQYLKGFRDPSTQSRKKLVFTNVTIFDSPCIFHDAGFTDLACTRGPAAAAAASSAAAALGQ